MERNDVNTLMERWAERAAEVRPDRKLRLRIEATAPSADLAAAKNSVTHRRWLAGWSSAACIAVAMAVGFAILAIPESKAAISCTVNGVPVTDPADIERHAIEALELATESLRRPAASLSRTLGAEPTMARVGEMLSELTNEQ